MIRNTIFYLKSRGYFFDLGSLQYTVRVSVCQSGIHYRDPKLRSEKREVSGPKIGDVTWCRDYNFHTFVCFFILLL